MLAVNVENLFSVMVLSVIITEFTLEKDIRSTGDVGNLSAKFPVSFKMRKYTVNSVFMGSNMN